MFDWLLYISYEVYSFYFLNLIVYKVKKQKIRSIIYTEDNIIFNFNYGRLIVVFIERNGIKFELTSEELRLAHEEYVKDSVKEDIASSFAANYLDCVDSQDFFAFVEDCYSNEDMPGGSLFKAYDELCDSFGEETVCWLVNNPEDFLSAAYKIYGKNLDANEDYNSQIQYAVKSVLCDKSFEFKLYKVQEALENGKVFPGDVGFDFKGTWIANPFLDETGRFEVDPVQHYGSVNVSRYADLFNEKASDNYIKDVLWRDVEGYDTGNLHNFINETPAGMDLCPDYRVFVCGDEITAEKNTIRERVHVPCYHVFAREISSEKHLVSSRTTDLTRKGFDECVEGVLVSLNAYNKSQMKLSAKAVHKDLYEKALINYCELSKIVDEFQGSFEELCVKLGGHNYEGNLFDVNFGVLCATVEDNGATRWVSTESVDIWNDSMDSMIEECISLSKLIEICTDLGIEVDYSIIDTVGVSDKDVIKATTDYKEEYYIVQSDVHKIDNSWIKAAYEANSFDNLDDAMALAHKLCDDIVGLAKEHEETGDVLEDVCVLRVVENDAGLRVKEEVVFVQKYNEQEQALNETEIIKATTISFTSNEGPDATQFDTQDQAEMLELFGQFLEENNLELVSIDSIEPCEIVEKVPKVASVDELLNNAKRTCESLSKGESIKNTIELEKE